MRYLLLSLMLIVATVVTAQTDRVRVRIFSTATVSQVSVTLDLGVYHLYADGKPIDTTLTEGTTVDLCRQGSSVRVNVGSFCYGAFSSVTFTATDTACILCINPRNTTQRSYEGNLEVTPTKSKGLLLINDVEFETYLAGVAQSEIYGDLSDIFRVQAIISRTWAMRNIHKHRDEGYNFCDNVHCQAYHNRCVRPDIMLGTIASSGEIIVDDAGNLIETPFHSNSGGETANSEDVWRSALPYLRSVPDTFSCSMKQSTWTQSFSSAQWLNYFSKQHHLNVSDAAVRQELLMFSQPHRKSKIMGVPLTRVRVDFKLKSTFFDVVYDSASRRVILNGRGYGHGVGLSQEGAIRMVRLGIPCDKIIEHYYTGAHVYKDPEAEHHYVQRYVSQIEQIIEEDRQRPSATRSKKDDWLGRLFRLRDRLEREEVYDAKQELEEDWQYEW